jgi:hypothetical protein
VKVTIHISHTEADDLAEVEAAARRLGMAVTARGAFMGKSHTEFGAAMSPSALADLLAADEVSAEAA